MCVPPGHGVHVISGFHGTIPKGGIIIGLLLIPGPGHRLLRVLAPHSPGQNGRKLLTLNVRPVDIHGNAYAIAHCHHYVLFLFYLVNRSGSFLLYNLRVSVEEDPLYIRAIGHGLGSRFIAFDCPSDRIANVDAGP